MIIKVKVQGKERELSGDLTDNLWFLNQPKDKEEVGIYCSLTLSEWNDPTIHGLIAAK